jgi:hypothetical protein
MNAPAVSDAGLLAEPNALVTYLRAHDYPLGVEDDLRLATLSDHLRARHGAPRTLVELCRVVAPLVCRDPAQQERLPAILERWVRLQVGTAAEELDRAASPAGAAVAKAEHRNRWLALVLVVLSVLLLVVGAALSLRPQRTQPTGPTPDSAPIASTASGGFTPPPIDIYAIFALLPLVGAGAGYLLRRRESALTREMVPRDAERGALKIALSESPLFRPGAIRTALRDLRRHRLLTSNDIDASASVAATVRNAGMVRLVRARRPVLPDYILLVDRATRNDHLGDLADVLMARLRADQFRITRGEFRGDPRMVTLLTDRGRERQALEDLAHDYPEARLLLIADIGSFWDPVREAWRNWVDDLRAFGSTAVITPLPKAQWGLRERELAELGFLLAPATSDGLSELAEQFRSDIPFTAPRETDDHLLDRMLATDPLGWTSDQPPQQSSIEALVDALRTALGPPAFLHLCAVAVFPAIHPRLTEQIGAALTTTEGVSILTEESYATLSRLPWLRRGRIPNWLRRALILALSEEDAARVRGVWVRALEPTPEPEAAALRLDVVRPPSTERALRRLLVDLIRRGRTPPVLQEELLLAFLEGRRPPELTVAAPRRVLGEGRLRLPRPNVVDAGLLAIGLALGMVIYLYGGRVEGILRTLPEDVFISAVLVSIVASGAGALWRAIRGNSWPSKVLGLAAVIASFVSLGVGLAFMVLVGASALMILAWSFSPASSRPSSSWSSIASDIVVGRLWVVPTAIALMAQLANWSFERRLDAGANGVSWVLSLVLVTSLSGPVAGTAAWIVSAPTPARRDFSVVVAATTAIVSTWLLLPLIVLGVVLPLPAWGVLSRADLLVGLPLLAVFWITTVGEGSRLGRAAIVGGTLAVILFRTWWAAAGDISEGLRVLGVLATPMEFYILTRGRGRSRAIISALAYQAILSLAAYSLFKLSSGIETWLWVSVVWGVSPGLLWALLVGSRGIEGLNAVGRLLRHRTADVAAIAAFFVLSLAYRDGDVEISLGLMAIPLVLLLSRRFEPGRVRVWVAAGAWPMLLVLQSPTPIGTLGDPGLYAVLLYLPTLATGDLMRRWLGADRLSLVNIGFLLLPLGAIVSLTAGARREVGLLWDFTYFQALLLFLVGLSQIDVRRLLLLGSSAALVMWLPQLLLEPRSINGAWTLYMEPPFKDVGCIVTPLLALLGGRQLRPFVLGDARPSNPTKFYWSEAASGLASPPTLALFGVLMLGPLRMMPEYAAQQDFVYSSVALCLAPAAVLTSGRLAQLLMVFGVVAPVLLLSPTIGDLALWSWTIGHFEFHSALPKQLSDALTWLAALALSELTLRALAPRNVGPSQQARA